MATAAELVAEPELDIEPLTPEVGAIAAGVGTRSGYSKHELAVFRIGHDDVEHLALTILNYPNVTRKGKPRRSTRLNARPHVSEAEFEDSLEQTPTFTITIHDEDWELLNLGALEHPMDINPGRIPNRWYRLSRISVVDSDITLTFETRNAVHLANIKKRHKVNRKRMTRAEFIKSLLRDVKKTRIKFVSPELHKKQKIRKTVFDSERVRKRSRAHGFTPSDKITVKGVTASPLQRRTIEKIIAAGLDVKAPGLVIVSAVMCTIVESNAGAHTTGNPPYVGPFQQNRAMGWPATGDAYKDAKGYYAKAIPYWREHHNEMTLGGIVMRVQGALPSLNALNTGFDAKADQARPEAQHAVNAYGGVEVGDPGVPGTIDVKEPYFFTTGPPGGPRRENHLAAIYRLAEEVHWRAFWVKDVLYYMSEEDLFKQAAVTRLRRYDNGVEHVNFSWDRGKRINEMIITVRMERWICPVGTVVVFDEGGPAKGRWLVSNIRRSMFDELGEITLKKPMRERFEPANDPGTKDVDPDSKAGVLDAPGGDIVGGGGIEDVKRSWTPKQVIDRIVKPKARNHGCTITSELRGNDSDSMHSGPANYQWAIDMSNGHSPTPQMDDLAAELIMAFNLPDLNLTLERSSQSRQWSENPNIKGFDIEVGYRTWEGGDHFNHVHFGCRRVEPAPAPQIHRPEF